MWNYQTHSEICISLIMEEWWYQELGDAIGPKIWQSSQNIFSQESTSHALSGVINMQLIVNRSTDEYEISKCIQFWIQVIKLKNMILQDVDLGFNLLDLHLTNNNHSASFYWGLHHS